MRTIFSREKSFNDPWVGNVMLNKMGLHPLRMRLAAAFNSLRVKRASIDSDSVSDLRTNGYICLPDFLPDAPFKRLRSDVVKYATDIEGTNPFPQNDQEGFQDKVDHDWGFDRFDGGTLNRFLTLDEGTVPSIAAFREHNDLNALCLAVTGRKFRKDKMWIYQTIHGDDISIPDLQKDLHRDTFFSSMKFWYFLEPVSLDDGPFIYVPESHELNRQRLAWEKRQAVRSVTTSGANRSGSFRIDEQDLAALGYGAGESITVAANTLVMADTLGFHRRGNAKPGARRLAIYGNLRPHPFAVNN